MSDEPTPRQRAILDFLRDHIRDCGRPPTMRETAAHFGWASNGAVRCHLTALERKGLIQWDRGEARGIRIVGEADAERVLLVPLVGSVPAGLPCDALPESGESVAIVESAFPRPKELFALRVFGNSMTGAGIMDGDKLIVRRAVEANPGQIVVANIDGQTTVKRFLRHGRRPILHPENPSFEDIKPKPGEEWRIEGIAVGLSRFF